VTRHVDYARFDADLFEHRKFIRLLSLPRGHEAAFGWWRLVLWARKNTDPAKPGDAGVIDHAVARHVLGDGCEWIMDLLAEVHLLDEQLGQWQLHDYAEHQDLAGWQQRQERARRAGQASARTRGSAQVQLGVNGELNHNPTQPIEDQKHVAALARFDEFWGVYAYKIDKQAAVKSWAKAVKTSSPQVIINGAREYAAHRHPEYVKHASTWLNGACWENEYVKPPDEPGTAPWEAR
jgi:hypothetical protein